MAAPELAKETAGGILLHEGHHVIEHNFLAVHVLIGRVLVIVPLQVLAQAVDEGIDAAEVFAQPGFETAAEGIVVLHEGADGAVLVEIATVFVFPGIAIIFVFSFVFVVGIDGIGVARQAFDGFHGYEQVGRDT